MSMDHRLDKLEKAAADACDCGNPPTWAMVEDDHWYGGSAPVEDVPEPCPRCGRPSVMVIRVIEDPDWYNNRAHELASEQGGAGHGQPQVAEQAEG